MGWVKLDDNFFRNPKVLEISGEAKLLYVAGICYSGSSLTDGFIPKNAVRSLAADADVSANSKRVKELLNAGLWEENPRGYGIHDYLDHNTSADDVRKKREQARHRARKQRGEFAETSREVPENNSESSREVTEPETETETETETSEAKASGKGASAPKPKPNRATQVPDIFPITDGLIAWGEKNGFTVRQMESQVELFQDHYRSKGETRKDWVASFRTWMHNARDWGHLDKKKNLPANN